MSSYRSLPTQCLTCPLSSLPLEQFPAAKTTVNGPMSGKRHFATDIVGQINYAHGKIAAT